MPNAVTISSPNLDQAIAALSAFVGDMAGAVASCNEELVALMEGVVTRLYGPRLATHFEITPEAAGAGAGTLAALRIFSDDKRVIGFEKGIRPYTITPRRPGGVLAWPIPGPSAFSRRVHHPGTRGHHRAGELQATLANAAFEVWSNAIYDVLPRW